MIRLSNVSKFYYTKGVIASGFTKVNLNFDMGEFVAITGESGSGKSTLLNVISGLDTYEEGEMYVDGNETSHFTEKDFEEYRRKYIGNIFQSFNLVNSYTVYQNVELVLLLAGMKRKDAKKRALELIEKVGLYEYRRTKASKLSGGQKQRVAIARALAKDTPIIIADEPTGNLDSESANDVFRILSEISKEKLVIVVTHNYEQVADYITRRITMHDGKVIEDYQVRQNAAPSETEEEKKDEKEIIEEVKEKKVKNLRFFNRLRLGIRNTFNIPVKFMLLILVFLFISAALISQYASLRASIYQAEISGWNWYFDNASENRIVIKKLEDNTAVQFTKEDFDEIRNLDNIWQVVEQDLLVEGRVSMATENYEIDLYGYVSGFSDMPKDLKLECGRYPEAENEVLLVTDREGYMWYEPEDYLEKPFFRFKNYGQDMESPYYVTGVCYVDASENPLLTSYSNLLYVSDEMLKEILLDTNIDRSTTSCIFLGEEHTDMYPQWHIQVSKKVKPGEAVVPEELNWYVEKTYKAVGKTLSIKAVNKYFTEQKDLKIVKAYREKEITNYMSIPKGESTAWYNGFIFVNPDDYMSLFDKDSYQASVFVKDAHTVNETAAKLEEMGYKTLVLKDARYKDESAALLRLVSNFMTAFAAVVLVFVGYFVIRIILKSRNVYYSTIRMLGANVGVSRVLLMIELVLDATIAYGLTVGLVYLGSIYFPEQQLISNVLQYFDLNSYIIVYVILAVIAVLISLRYSRKLFTNSTIKTIKEEV
ncbi:MAG: ATP-binding cassette domain-containing protein [Clostridia bacterium]|nr:ATP-binding cassette domain-containing protein [Clostridia bacterium]